MFGFVFYLSAERCLSAHLQVFAPAVLFEPVPFVAQVFVLQVFLLPELFSALQAVPAFEPVPEPFFCASCCAKSLA